MNIISIVNSNDSDNFSPLFSPPLDCRYQFCFTVLACWIPETRLCANVTPESTDSGDCHFRCRLRDIIGVTSVWPWWGPQAILDGHAVATNLSVTLITSWYVLFYLHLPHCQWVSIIDYHRSSICPCQYVSVIDDLDKANAFDHIAFF